ncbi:MAG: hypothetical protein H0U53_04940, partial [Actinobacteria bacterium]|nr:hypothetical protein [Actinomycetota bacterium]
MPDRGRHGGAKGRFKKPKEAAPPPAESGPRRAALQERKRTERRKRTLFGTILAVMGTIAGVGLVFLLAREATSPDPEPEPTRSPVAEKPIVTLLFG